MALKAGRVGVAKNQVDEFGNIIGGSAPDNVYTKSQCDNKFETKTHASNTYQPKTIEVPLELLDDSQLTVESSLHALEDTLGTLRFRNNDGTAQYKLPNGEWANFNSGGSGVIDLPCVDCSSLSPQTAGRVDVFLGVNKVAWKKLQVYTDSNFEHAFGSMIDIPNCLVVFKSLPVSSRIYYKLLQADGTTSISATYASGTTSTGAWTNSPNGTSLQTGNNAGSQGMVMLN